MEVLDLIIIGGGPAGLTAALYGKRAKLNTILLERSVVGGQLAYSGVIENYPGILETKGFELAQMMEEQVKRLGLEILHEEAVALSRRRRLIDVKTTQSIYKARSVIIAVGDEPLTLGLENERRLIGHGVSYCATCDGPLYAGKTVGVVGGGDSAVSEALYLASIAKKVHLIHRRDKLRAEKVSSEKLLAKANVQFEWNSIVTSLNGRERLESVTVENVRTGETRELAVEALFIYIGRKPLTGFLTDLEKDEWGYIKVDQDMQTSLKGVYAAGDCASPKWRQIASAVGDGAKAAISAIKYVEREFTT
ncbi:MAG: thioredoxin-disulfide reductase [Candidatus Bathyarchaeia archaeon]